MRSQARRLFLFGILSFGVVMGATEAFPQSLLHGATATSYNAPAGWSVIHTQGCESGVNDQKEYIGPGCTATRPHTGAQSIEGTHSSDGASTRWLGTGRALGIGREIYVSWWEYLEAQSRQNDEMFLFQVIKRNLPSGNPNFQEIVVDWYYNNAGTYNSTNARLIATGQGGFKDAIVWSGDQELTRGQWVQWEVHLKTNAPGASDGLIRVYRNGILNTSWSNLTLNGLADMTGTDIQIGGTYTRHVWRHADNSCGTFIGDGQAIAKAGFPDQNYRCVDYTACSCAPNTPVFHRYFDDIIVMIPTGSGGGISLDVPSGPPAAPGGLTFQ